jgi:hypothetical protein
VSRNLARAIEFRVSYVSAIFVQFLHATVKFSKSKLVRHTLQLHSRFGSLCQEKEVVGCITSILRRRQQQRDCRDNKEVIICLNSSPPEKSTMKFSIAIFLASTASSTFANAFTPTTSAVGRTTGTSSALGGMSSDVGIPCTEECALTSFPNLPDSIHPGVLSGQAMMDLLQHAKDNGKEIKKVLSVEVRYRAYKPCMIIINKR